MRKLRVALAGALAAVTTAGLAGAQPAQASPPRHPAAAPAAVPAAAPAAGSFVPVTPFRAADSRRSGGPVAAKHGLKVLIGGHGAVPARNVAAVAVTLTAVSPSASGGLIAYAFGGTRPAVRNLTYRSGTSITVTTVSRVSAAGVLDVYNDAGAGRTDIVVDVTGYYAGGDTSTTQAGIFHALPVPKRVVDTRGSRAGALKAGTSRDATIGGLAGVPRSGVGSVVVAITAMSPTASGAVSTYSLGNDRPATPTASYVSGQDSTSFAIVPTNDSGAITIANVAARGSVQVAVDVLGWTNAGPAAVAGATQTRYPNRVLDGAWIAAGRTGTVQVAGRGGVPLRNVSAALVRLAVGSPQHTGGLTVWAGGRMPGTTALQFPYRQSAANLVIVPMSSSGSFSYHNASTGRLAMSVDIVGYVPSSTVTAPTVSSSRYVHTETELNGRFADPSTSGEGCIDATTNSTLVLLDFGAQANDKSGVVLTGANQDKVSYASLVNAVDGYLTSFASCSPPANAIIALGTNNEGDFAAYSATDRGADWATKVLEAVSLPPSSSIRLMGANDIEPLFSSTEPQAAEWETAYLTNTTHDLVFNGSADQCPTAFAMPDQACGTYGWTELGIYHLMTSSVPGKTVHALPQSYNPGMAAQWANIDQTGIEHGGTPIDFIGALTEQAVCTPPVEGCSVPNYAPADGWTALYRAISTVVPAPSIPAVTDLRADS